MIYILCILERGMVRMSRLVEIQQEYERIMESKTSDYEKDKQLAKLMTQMEREFQIPGFQDKVWEERNRPVIAMYRKLSMSRRTV